jgi:PAS domain S-box-containing protein
MGTRMPTGFGKAVMRVAPYRGRGGRDEGPGEVTGPDPALGADFPRAVLHHLGTGVLAMDASGRITYANPWAERLLGRPAAGMTGQDAHDLLHRRADGGRVPRERCVLRTPLRTSVFAEQGSQEFFERADGTVMPIIWSTTPLLRAGRQTGMVLVFDDFSLYRAAEQRMAAHTAALEQLTGRLNLLADVSSVLMSAVDAVDRMRRLLRLLVPALGDWAAVALCAEPAGTLEQIAVHCPAHPHRAHQLEGPLPLPPRSAAAVMRLMSAEEPVLLTAADTRDPSAPLAPVTGRLLDRLGGHSAVVTPLPARRKHYGMLTVGRTGDPPAPTDAEVRLLSDIGRRVGLVLDNARLYREQRNVAETLQRQLLSPLPQVNHIRMAARYLPAQSAMQVGGDWYDAFLLRDGVVAVVIGDVVGHDLKAAAHMAEVRNMLRALAWDHQKPPSVIMSRLDEAVTYTSDAPMATLVFARIEGPEGGPWRLNWVNAGHPPPLLVTREGHTRFLTGGHGPLIGMSAALHLGLSWPDADEPLPPECTLVFYTDGLVESRGRPIDAGMAKLRHNAAVLARRLRDATVDDFCDQLLQRVRPSEDDAALLALRLPARGAGTPGDPHPEPPPQAPCSPAAPDRAAPGSAQEDALVTDPTRAPRPR